MSGRAEIAWASQFICETHGNMGACAALADAVTSRKTCRICEQSKDQTAALLIRGPAYPPPSAPEKENDDEDSTN